MEMGCIIVAAVQLSNQVLGEDEKLTNYVFSTPLRSVIFDPF